MSASKRKPAEQIIKDFAVNATKEYRFAVYLARSKEDELALTTVREIQNCALKAKKLLASALRQKLLPSRDNVNAALGYAEDARLSALASTISVRNIIRQRKSAGEAAKLIRASSDAVGYMTAAAELLHDALQGGDATLAMRKALNAVELITNLADEATKSGDPNAEDATAAKAVADDLAKRFRVLAEQAQRAGKVKGSAAPGITPNVVQNEMGGDVGVQSVE